MTVQPTERGDADRSVDDDAERRHVVKQRALELKRSLLEVTWRLSPEQAAAYNEAARAARRAKRRSGALLRLCVAALTGALSMWVPISSTSSLPGQLSTGSPGTAVGRHVLAYAQPSQCARLRVDRPASLMTDASSLRFEAQIARVSPHAGTGDATCQIELQLEDSQQLRELPAHAALTAVLPMQPSSWLAVLANKTANEHALSVLTGLGETALQRSSALIASIWQNQNARQHWETLRQILVPDEP